MSGQEKNASQKKRGRPATGRGQTIGVRIHGDLLAEIDNWIEKSGNNSTRPEAIRKFVLTMTSMLKHSDSIEDIEKKFDLLQSNKKAVANNPK